MSSSINNDKKTPAEKAVEAKAPSDGPHTNRARIAVAKEKEAKDPGDKPAYVITMSAHDEEKPKIFYKPEELRAKARAMLGSNKLNPEERKVLAEILGPEKET